MLVNVADYRTFIRRIITGDDTWVYEYDVETAQKSSEQRTKNMPKPKYKLNYPLRGTRHESIQAIKRTSVKELKAISAEAYKKCMENWINRQHAYIGSKGAYFEGGNKDLY